MAALVIVAAIMVLGLLYVTLFRCVRDRGLSENLVLFGFSPWLVLPILLYACTLAPTRPAAAHTPADGGVDISAMDNRFLLWAVAIVGVFPPLVMNVVAWCAMRFVPQRVDHRGVHMRSRKCYLWRECLHYTAFSDYLRLTFSSGVVRVQRPVGQETSEFHFILRMLDRHDVYEG